MKDHDIRKEAFLDNYRPPPPLKGFLTLFMEALNDFTLKILMGAAVVSIAIEVGTAQTNSKRAIAWIEGFAILVAVAICATVTAVNDW